MQNAVRSAQMFGIHASKPSHHIALQAVCMQSRRPLGLRFANEPGMREFLSMQGHVILVVEPGLILQQSQRISPRHTGANAACLVRIVLAGRKRGHSAIFLRLCPASLVVSVMIHAGIWATPAYWNIFWYSSGRSSFSTFLFARTIVRFVIVYVCCYRRMKRGRSVVDTKGTSNACNDPVRLHGAE